MEDWEDQISEEINLIIDHNMDRGMTARQMIGILSTIKFELIANMAVIESDLEE